MKVRFLSILLVCIFGLATSCGAQQQDGREADGQPVDPDDSLPRARVEAPVQATMRAEFSEDRTGGTGNRANQNSRRGKAENGANRFIDSGGRREILITHRRPGDRIVIDIEETFDAENMSMLGNRYPELEDFVDLFPQQTGNTSVRLALTLTTRYEAEDLNELKEKFPKAFNLYRRYRSQIDANREEIRSNPPRARISR